MKKRLLFILTTLLAFSSYSQISFEKGYYINNKNQKINCLIKNNDWMNTPNKFEYKLLEESEVKIGTLKAIKEFGIDNTSRYIKTTLNLDTSSDKINNLSKTEALISHEETLFLRVLISGKGNLYLYQGKGVKKYFYNKESTSIKQLTYKVYNKNGKIYENNDFRNQLWKDLKCSTFKMDRFKNLNYKKNELINLFIAYNKCSNQEYYNYEEKQKKDLFNLTLRPGFNSSSLSIEQTSNNFRDTDFGYETTFRLGIEAEFIMPFNKNKWAIIIEPTYQYFKSEGNNTTNQSILVDYKYIDFPIGIRHYFFLNKKSKLFINSSFVFSKSISTEITGGINLDIRSTSNIALGIGYKYNDKFSIELRQQTNRNILKNYISWSSKYSTSSLILGYSFF